MQLQRTKVSAAGIAELKKVLPNDHLGSDGVTALTNGNYVVTAANSLVGSTASDNVGSSSENVKALTNGNYVVTSTSWDNGALVDVGAVTWGNGTTGTSGAVSGANSLVGSAASDLVGYAGVTALPNGNYAVASSYWDNGALFEAGAVTFGNGTTGVTGAITATNSARGLTANTNLQSIVVDNVNGNFFGRFMGEGGGRVRVGSQTSGFANTVPVIGGAVANQTMNDPQTKTVFSTLTVTDPDTNPMSASVTILNGVFRGDFTPATTTGWTRTVSGNDICFARTYASAANIGATVQAAVRAFVFQPRTNSIKPNTTETTVFTGTRVTTTSVNNAPVIGGAVAGQTMNDNQTKAVFSTLTVTDLDTQAMNVIITIPSGVSRGDFTAGSATGWTRTVVGSDLRYNRFFAATTNIGVTVQTAIRALVFQPRTNVPIGTTETTGFTVLVNDGLASTTNSTTSVITTGVAPRPTSSTVSEASTIAPNDITTVVLPNLAKSSGNRLARLLRKLI